MTVFTDDGTWVVPSRRAVWVPPGKSHHIEMTGRVSLRTLYFRPELPGTLGNDGLLELSRVITVSGLLAELIHEILRIGPLYANDLPQLRLAGVLLDCLVEAPAVPLDLRFPTDPRARRLADRIVQAPGDATSLTTLARSAGASPRTLERLFQKELGMTLGRWRQQVRLLEALRLLASGATVSAAGSAIGYESTSAFIAMFKRCLGTTPRRYYQASPSDVSPL